MFSFLKKNFFSFCNVFSEKIISIFSSPNITDQELDQFFELLVSFDVGLDVAREAIVNVKSAVSRGEIKTATEILNYVKTFLSAILQSLPVAKFEPDVIILLGINGAGKTTTAAKLANLYSTSGKKVLLVAADTFRAAAVEQLQEWAKIAEVELFVGKKNGDPSSVIFDAGKYAQDNKFDTVIIDTAGRLHTNLNLLKELEKSLKIAQRVFPNKNIVSWIVLDAMLGQNSFQQVKIFHQAVNLDGVILTKLDGSAKGGVVFPIAKTFSLPVTFITIAENDLSGIMKFDSKEYIDKLFGTS